MKNALSLPLLSPLSRGRGHGGAADRDADAPVSSRAPSSTADSRRSRRLGDPELHQAISGTLAGRKCRVPLPEIPPLLNETMRRALECRFLPDDDDGCRQYVCGMARYVAADWRRNRKLPTTPFDELGEEAPRRDMGPVEARMVLEKALKGMTLRRGFAWFARHVLQGDSYATIAGEEGLDYKLVANAAEYAREQCEKKIMHTTILVAVLLLLWASVRDSFQPRRDVADPDNQPKTVQPAPAPKVDKKTDPIGVAVRPPASDTKAAVGAEPKLAPRQTHAQTRSAGELRTAALADCNGGRWQTCVAGLDEAYRIDPQGENLPEVIEARAKAGAAFDAEGNDDRKAR